MNFRHLSKRTQYVVGCYLFCFLICFLSLRVITNQSNPEANTATALQEQFVAPTNDSNSPLKSDLYTVAVTQGGVSQDAFVYVSRSDGTSGVWSRTNGQSFHYVTFSASQTVTVQITKLHSTATSATVYPSRLGIGTVATTDTKDGKMVSLSLPPRTKISVEFDDDPKDLSPIGVFVNPPEDQSLVPDPAAGNVLSVTDAKPDLSSIPAAKDTVYFASGIHDIGYWNVPYTVTHIYLAEGSVVRGYIYALHGKVTTVNGRGVLTADSYPFHYPDPYPDGNDPLSGSAYNLLVLNGGVNVLVEGITFATPTNFVIRIYGGTNPRVANVNIIGLKYNNDAVCFVNTLNPILENSFIIDNDDILTMYRPVNTIVRGNAFWSLQGGIIQLGWIPTSIKGMTITSNDIIHSAKNSSFLIFMNTSAAPAGDPNPDAPILENFNIQDIQFDTPIKQFLDLRMKRNLAASSDPSSHMDGKDHPAIIRNISFKDITVKTSNAATVPLNYMNGIDALHGVSKISFDNVTVNGVCVTGDNYKTAGLFSIADFVSDITFVCPGGNSQTILPSTPPTTAYDIAAWGDSLTSSDYPIPLASLTGYKVYDGGVGGETSSQIKARFDAAPEKHTLPTIIWVGRNNINDPVTIKSDIAAMVTALGHTKYLILGEVNGDYSNEYKDKPGYQNIIALNADLETLYGSHFIDIRPYLVSLYDASKPQDVIDHNHDVPPASLRIDQLHYNQTADVFIAKKIVEHINTLMGIVSASTPSDPGQGGNTPTPPVIIDTVPPTLTISGSTVITLTQRSIFTDPGATASDNVDGDITSHITTVGSVDTNTLGTYTITYQVSDAVGNKAQATRTITIIPVPPQVVSGGGYISSPSSVTVTTSQTPDAPVSHTIEFHVEQTPVTPPAPVVLPQPKSPSKPLSVKPSSPKQAKTPVVQPVVVPQPPVTTNPIVSIEYTLNNELLHTTTTFPDTWNFDTTTLSDNAYVLKTTYYYQDHTTDTSVTIFTVKNGRTLIESIGHWIGGVWEKVLGWF